jgi:crotonobetainyl-CoA:carnitine CoA-transferase CaiB-like acyl-CoA transferase
MRLSAATKLGLSYDDLRTVNPRLVYCHVSSYGPEGPRAQWPGYDQLFQASIGWEVENGGEGNPPMWQRTGQMDYLCATASVIATLLALRQRERTGEGQVVAASLLGAAVLTASGTFVRPDGTLSPFPRLDHDQTGTSPAHRMYRVDDGWVCVAALRDGELDRLCAVAGVDDPAGLESALASRSSESLLAALDDADVLATPVRTARSHAFFDDPATWNAGLAVEYPHPRFGRLRQVGAFWHLHGGEGAVAGRPAPGTGQHSVEILRDLGYDEPSIDDLRGRNVFRDGA